MAKKEKGREWLKQDKPVHNDPQDLQNNKK